MSTSDSDLAKILAKALLNQNTSSTPKPSEYDNSIVQVKAAGIGYSDIQPWKTPFRSAWRGTGFVIEGNKIITNAHVGDALFLQVKFPKNDPTLYRAKVEKIGQDCDLCMLTVDDPKFWEKANPLSLAKDVNVGDDVNVYGFPVGGKNICVTEGKVSRREYRHRYAHSGVRLPVAQLTAAIAPGNSGGPVLCNGQVVGVVHQGTNRQGGGQMIPIDVLHHFIDAPKIHPSKNFPGLSMKVQPLENATQREELGMSEDQSGIRIQKVDPLSAAKGLLRKGDILLSIDGININNDGTVCMETGELENFNVIINRKFIGEDVKFEVLRDGKQKKVDVELKNPIGATRLIPFLQETEQTRYYINAGLVFQRMTTNYSDYMCGALVPPRLQGLRNARRNEESEEVVLLSSAFVGPTTCHVRPFLNERVVEVNGREIIGVRDVIKAMENHDEDQHRIVLDDGQEFEIDNLTHEENKKLMLSYGVYCDRSACLEEKQESKSRKGKKRKREPMKAANDEHMSHLLSEGPSRVFQTAMIFSDPKDSPAFLQLEVKKAKAKKARLEVEDQGKTFQVTY